MGTNVPEFPAAAPEMVTSMDFYTCNDARNNWNPKTSMVKIELTANPYLHTQYFTFPGTLIAQELGFMTSETTPSTNCHVMITTRST